MRMKPGKPRPDLDELIRKSATHKLTPGEIWDQRISWAYGNLPDGNTTTREQVEARAIEMYGPRPPDGED